jgi:hypothetical protein
MWKDQQVWWNFKAHRGAQREGKVVRAGWICRGESSEQESEIHVTEEPE